jgi:hypothetical protein
MKEPERVLDKAVKTQESMKKELKSLEAEIKRPFEYEDKYQQLKQRAEEIDKELNIGNEATSEDADKKFSITESEEWTQTKDELYDSLEDIFGEGSKAEEIAPDEWIVTVPNGKRILIKIKDEIIFNEEELAQGKKEHGFTDDANVEVSGYWQRLTKDDVADGELVLSLRSPKGIAYHEILHAVMDLALTKKEKAASKDTALLFIIFK